ncbi:MAG: PaaI family thioesterase [Rhodobacteraceae bacterium]|nr:PaaI family thioesterase [Paracoccaceae bacterium]
MAQQAMTREPITPAKLLGFEVEIDPAAGQAHCLPEVDDRHINRHNALQGGIVATLLDVVAGVTASLAHDPQGLTPVSAVSLIINYVGPGRAGPIRAVGTRREGRV